MAKPIFISHTTFFKIRELTHMSPVNIVKKLTLNLKSWTKSQKPSP